MVNAGSSRNSFRSFEWGTAFREEALWFKHVDRNTWMLLTDENHVTHYCMHAKTLTKMAL